MTIHATSPDLVSVVIPCHQHGDVLPAALESVLGQTHARTEAVVVNDGSSDSTEAVARRYAERHPGRVVYVSQEQSGQAAARANGPPTGSTHRSERWQSRASQRKIG